MSRIIYTNPETGVAAIVNPAPGFLAEDLVSSTVPDGADYAIVADDVIPSDRTFRDAWVKTGATVVEDLAKSKVIAHEMRRAKRAEEFTPYDDLISKQIPGSDTDAAEASRAAIRTKYETLQSAIDNCTDIAGLKTTLNT